MSNGHPEPFLGVIGFGTWQSKSTNGAGFGTHKLLSEKQRDACGLAFYEMQISPEPHWQDIPLALSPANLKAAESARTAIRFEERCEVRHSFDADHVSATSDDRQQRIAAVP